MKSKFNYFSREMKTIMTQPLVPERTTPPTHAANDTGSLARELSAEFIQALWRFRKARDAEMSLFDPKDIEWTNLLQAMEDKSPDEVSFQELECLSREQPERALARWEEIKAAAREDVANGWHAARGVTGLAWGRAIFLAIRDQFHGVFPPRNGVEAMLLDEMAQYETLRRDLMGGLSRRSWSHDKDHKGQYLAPAAMMQAVDRLQRMLQYALRTLISLRRSRSPVTVASSETRNVADAVPVDAAVTSITEEPVS